MFGLAGPDSCPACEHPSPAMYRRALLIDAMGTLVSLADPVARLVALLRARAGVEVTPEDARTALRVEIAHYRAHMLSGRDVAGLAALHRDCARVLGDALGLEVAPSLLLDVLRFAPFGDAAPALTHARDSGNRVIVVSNWDVSLAAVLARVGLGSLVDGVVTSAEVGASKPAPEVFRVAAALAGVPARHCTHVGDSPIQDVDGARGAGMAAVLLVRGDGADVPPVAPGVPVIRTLADLSRLPS